MIKFLSSLKFTVILLSSLIIILLAGIFMTKSDIMYSEFKNMNDFIIRDWFIDAKEKNIGVLIWFCVLCLIAVLFGINLILCTVTALYKKITKSKFTTTFILFSLHLIFIIILLTHAISLFIGYKFGGIELAEAESYKFNNIYELFVTEINYIDDLKYVGSSMKKSRLQMTSDNFHYKENFANIVLTQNTDTVFQGNVYIFKPVYFKGIQITLEKFKYDEDSKLMYADFAITKNPLQSLFFIFYGLGIILLSVYLILRWNKNSYVTKNE